MVEDTPDDIVHEYLWKAMYGNDPLGSPILGTKETLNTFTKETILSYMENIIHQKILLSLLQVI